MSNKRLSKHISVELNDYNITSAFNEAQEQVKSIVLDMEEEPYRYTIQFVSVTKQVTKYEKSIYIFMFYVED